MLRHMLCKEDLHKCGIYTITNDYNEMTYIGSTKDFYKRWLQHKAMLRRSAHTNRYMQHAYTKHEGNGFTFTIMEVTSEDSRLSIEQEYLDVYKDSWDKLYNICNKVDIIHTGPDPLRREVTRCDNAEWLTKAIKLLDGTMMISEVAKLLGQPTTRIMPFLQGRSLSWLVDEICEEHNLQKPKAKKVEGPHSDTRKALQVQGMRSKHRAKNASWVLKAIKLLDGSRTTQEVASLVSRSVDVIRYVLRGTCHAWLVDELCKEHNLSKPLRYNPHTSWVTEAIQLLDGTHSIQEVATTVGKHSSSIRALLKGAYHSKLVTKICKECNLPKPKRKDTL